MILLEPASAGFLFRLQAGSRLKPAANTYSFFHRYPPAKAGGRRGAGSSRLIKTHLLHGDSSDRRLVRRLLRELLQDFQQHVIGVESFGLGFEVENDAVPQGRQIDAADVFEADVIA